MKTQSAEVMDNGRRVGLLSRQGEKYIFRYDDVCFRSTDPPISLSLPKTRQEYVATYLFPFFAGLLAEGTNKSMQIRQLHIAEADEFTRLLLTAHTQSIGSITVRELSTNE